MENKARPALIYGGQSPEHEVSLSSARNALTFLEISEPDLLLIKITRSGIWLLCDRICESDEGKVLDLSPGSGITIRSSAATPAALSISLAYLVIHGTNCEDGTLQSTLETLRIPYTGCDSTVSAICISKKRTKEKVSSQADTVPGLSFDRIPSAAELSELGLPLIVKPEASGSSVGVGILKSYDPTLISELFQNSRYFSEEVLFEKLIYPNRELECGVFEKDGKVVALEPCELVHQDLFLSYDGKYNHGGNYVRCPAPVGTDLKKKIQELSCAVFRALGCSGFSRIDFLLDLKDGRLYFSEINTIPGLTQTSHFPRMLEASGFTLGDLFSSLKETALGKGRN